MGKLIKLKENICYEQITIRSILMAMGMVSITSGYKCIDTGDVVVCIFSLMVGMLFIFAYQLMDIEKKE